MSVHATPVGKTLEIPLTDALGSGGKLTAELIDTIFLPAFHNPTLDKLDDQAVLTIAGARLAFSTDSFVVTPIFFPGGDLDVAEKLRNVAQGWLFEPYLAKWCAETFRRCLTRKDHDDESEQTMMMHPERLGVPMVARSSGCYRHGIRL